MSELPRPAAWVQLGCDDDSWRASTALDYDNLTWFWKGEERRKAQLEAGDRRELEPQLRK